MKRILILAALACGTAILAGCGPSDGAGAAGSGDTNAANGKRLRIGVSIPAADHGWTAGVKYWAEQASKLHPEIDWTISTAGTPDKQITDIETMMTAGIDGLVVLATESAPITPIAKTVHERGIFLVNVDRGFLEPVADVFLEGDNVAFGAKSAEYMAKKLNGTGKVIVLEGISSTVNTDRVNAFRDTMKAYPGIQILDSQSGQWNREKAHGVMQTLLTKHPQFDAVWAADDDMALGAEQAIKDAGRGGQIWILGGAGMKDVVKRVMDGDAMFPADITYPPSMIATGIEIAASALKGGNVAKKKPYLPKHIMIDVEMITPENAKDYYFPDSIY